MNPTSEILERISKSSTDHKDGVFTRLYRYLLREDIYYAAYQKLYANKGAATKGVDADTADGFGDKYVKTLIAELKSGTYRAKPVRRQYIQKANGKMRPLGIPSFRDKLLQEVIRQILEAIYEPTLAITPTVLDQTGVVTPALNSSKLSLPGWSGLSRATSKGVLTILTMRF